MNIQNNERHTHSKFEMTPALARQISFDGYSATEPEKKIKKQIINIRDFRLE